MLRIALLVLSGLAFAAALAGLWPEGRDSWAPAVVTGIVFLGIALENFRYKRLQRDIPGAGWEATGERFIDPESGETVAVYFDPASGERRYVSGQR
ncbi:MAG TPA: hypothetical protein VFP14_04065 [Novosphingobium sp.]|nr:hypothetical protein [Novosphingobium sp.]